MGFDWIYVRDLTGYMCDFDWIYVWDLSGDLTGYMCGI